MRKMGIPFSTSDIPGEWIRGWNADYAAAHDTNDTA